MTTAVEETLVLVKPDGVARNLTGEILRRIEAKGYSLVDVRMLQADRDLLAKHYAELEKRWKIKEQKHRAELEKRKVMTPFGMMENHSYPAKGGEA